MSARFTNASSSFRSRFSRRIFRLNGSRSTVLPGSVATLVEAEDGVLPPRDIERRAAAEGVRVCHGSSLAVRPVVMGLRARGITEPLRAPPSAARQAIRNLQSHAATSGAGHATRSLVSRWPLWSYRTRRPARTPALPSRTTTAGAARRGSAASPSSMRRSGSITSTTRNRDSDAARRARTDSARRRSQESHRAVRRASAARGAGSRARAFAADRNPFPRSPSTR